MYKKVHFQKFHHEVYVINSWSNKLKDRAPRALQNYI